MFTLDFISARGNLMPLVNNEYFNFAGADGLTSTNVSVASSAVPAMDGDSINNVQAQPRPIVLYLEAKSGKNVEEFKRYVTTYAKPKLPGTLRWNYNGREIEIAGIVQAMEMPRFSQKCVMQISLYCSEPYWADLNYLYTELSNIVGMHYFPLDMGGLYFPPEGVPFGVYERNHIKEYVNEGDVASGMIITITAMTVATNPVLRNMHTGQFIGINDILVSGDEVIISTYKGRKTITKNGVNIIDKIMPGSTFLQLEVGSNEFMVDSDDEDLANMYFTLTYKRLYV
jgi:hypothetical protein